MEISNQLKPANDILRVDTDKLTVVMSDGLERIHKIAECNQVIQAELKETETCCKGKGGDKLRMVFRKNLEEFEKQTKYMNNQILKLGSIYKNYELGEKKTVLTVEMLAGEREETP